MRRLTLARPGEPSGPASQPERWLLAAVALATVLAPLNSTMIAVALPSLAAELGVGVGESSWLVVGYLIAMAVIQPIAGTLGDSFGRRRLVLGALVGFLVASLAASLASSFAMLVALRLAQALSGALALPNGAALVREHLPDGRRAGAYGLIGAAAGLAAGLGPPLGGLLVGLSGWRAIFALNVPIVLAALVVGWIALPAGRPDQRGGRFDLAGSTLLAGWLGLLAYTASSAGRESVLLPLPLLAALTLGLFAGFVVWERRVERPVVRLDLFRTPGFAAAAATVALGNLAMYSTLLAVPQYLDVVARRPSAEIGVVLAALSVPMVLLAPFGGRLADQFGRRRIALTGGAVTAAALLPLLWLDSSWPSWLLAGPLLFAGCGLALQAPSVQAAAVESAPARYAGVASGVFSTSRYLGSIVGSAVLGALLAANGGPAAGGLLAVFLMVVAAALGSLAAASRLDA